MKESTASTSQLRLRVFAGPNGSGKSTVIEAVRKLKIADRKVDFGYYINADEIAKKLRTGGFGFTSYKLDVSNAAFQVFASASGLLSEKFPFSKFKISYTLRSQKITVRRTEYVEQLAQIIARFLRQEMLRLNRRFSFETVFSHASNLDIMREARDKGYKVYLYFVSTEDPQINVFRVKFRVKQGGHDVPEEKIIKRYYNSLNLLEDAIDLSYQCFCFDNSRDQQPFTLIAHGKEQGTKKQWDKTSPKIIPSWFKKYYLKKQN